jgi:3'(2'),5'-bisphosphate nucleotidase
VPDHEPELLVAIRAAENAAGVIMRHYRAGPTSARDKADGSPVTEVDLAANEVIESTLRQAFPDDAILSEESPDSSARLTAERVWIVDPIDGTRGFLARTDDFCVHVALAIAGAPVVGVVMQPVSGAIYQAVVGQGAFLGATRLGVSDRARLPELRLGISRHNAPATLLGWLEREGLAAAATRSGASIKFTALAAGDLDGVVTVTGGEKEWDTCAPEIIVREAGGVVTDGDGQALRYNQPRVDRPRGIVASNGHCHAALLTAVAPLLDPPGAPS